MKVIPSDFALMYYYVDALSHGHRELLDYAGQTPNSGHELQFMYYDYSKIMLAQLKTKCIFHDFFVCLVFVIDLLTYPYQKNFPKMIDFQIVKVQRANLTCD